MARETSGSTDRIVISDDAQIKFGATSFSILITVTPNNSNQNGWLLAKRKDTSPFEWYGIAISGDSAFGSSGKKILAWIKSTDANFRKTITTADFADGNKHEICAVFDTVADDATLFIDGIEVSQTQSSGGSYPDTDHTQALAIGNNHGGGFGTNLDMVAEVGLFSDVLDANSVLAHSKGIRINRIRSDLRTFYMPVFGDSPTEPDLSGNQNNGTVTGATKVNHPPVSLLTRIEKASMPFVSVVGPAIRNIASSLSLGGGITSRKLIAPRSPPSQSVSLTESASTLLTPFRSIANSIPSFSGSTARILHAVRSMTNDISFSDGVTGTLSLMIISIANTLSNITGNASRKLIAKRELKEEHGSFTDVSFTDISFTKDTGGISLSSNVISQIVIPRSISDSLPSLSEITSVILSAKTFITNNIPINDSVTGVILGIKVTVSDSITFSGSVARILHAVRSISNSISLPSALTGKIIFTEFIADTLSNITGTLSIKYIAKRTISTLVSFPSLISLQLSAVRSASGSISISDGITAVKARFTDITNNLSSFAGTVSGKAILKRTLTSTPINFTDAVSTLIIRGANLVGTITLSSTVSRKLSAIRVIIESVSLFSSVMAIKVAVKSIANSIPLSSTVTAKKIKSINISGSIGLSAVLSRAFSISKNITESINLAAAVLGINLNIISKDRKTLPLGNFSGKDSSELQKMNGSNSADLNKFSGINYNDLGGF